MIYFQFSAPSTGFETLALLWQRQKMTKKCIIHASFRHLAANMAILVFFSSLGLGRAVAKAEEFGETAIENPFDEAYWGVELTSNSPAARTTEHLLAGRLQPALTYRYRLSTGWLLGAFGGFKNLKRRNTESNLPEDLAVLSFGYESLKGWRLYHPLYFFAGGKLSYYLPATEAMLPLLHDAQFRSEFGGSAVAMLALKPAGIWLLTARIERWRGLASTNLQGYETALGILVNF